MDRIDGIRTFVAVVEAGSFSAAAKRLGISNKLVSKYIAALENQVGSMLLFRTTRSMSITSEGKLYLEGCRRVLEDIEALDASLESSAGLRGTLRAAAPVTFGETLVSEAAVDFMNVHPDMEIDLVLSDTQEDLAEKGFDLAIRIGTLRDSNLRVSKLGDTLLTVVASPEYLAKHGAPQHPAELADQTCILDSNAEVPGRWPFLNEGRKLSVAVDGPFVCNSAAAGIIAAQKGSGLALVPDIFVQREVGEGRLVEVLKGNQLRPIPIQAVFLPSKFRRAKVETFIDHMKDSISERRALCDAAKTLRGG